MQVISLWNADHLPASLPMSTSISLPMIAPNGSITSKSNIAVAEQCGAITYNGKKWLMLGGVSTYGYRAYLSLQPALSTMKGNYPNVKKVYCGVRVNCFSITSGGTLFYFSSGGAGVTATPNQEYFVEVVTDLVDSTRELYINGTLYSNSLAESAIYLGQYLSSNKLLTGTGQSLLFTDYYQAVAYIGDTEIPARLGKMSVKSAAVDVVTNDSKFKIINADNDSRTIPYVLNMYRSSFTANTAMAVQTDANESAMKLNFTSPANGDTVVGAHLRVSAYKNATDQAALYTTIQGEKTPASIAAETATVANNVGYIITNPEGGWSEEAIGALDIKLSSRRTV